jgi:hypothetical protein
MMAIFLSQHGGVALSLGWARNYVAGDWVICFCFYFCFLLSTFYFLLFAFISTPASMGAESRARSQEARSQMGRGPKRVGRGRGLLTCFFLHSSAPLPPVLGWDGDMYGHQHPGASGLCGGSQDQASFVGSGSGRLIVAPFF